MPEHAKPLVSSWADEFTKPTLADLLGGLDPAERAAFKDARSGLRDAFGSRDRIRWLGLPWRWTVCSTLPGLEQPALAYLIPEPGAARGCIPVSTEAEIEVENLTRPVRQRLDLAPIIAGYFWPEWPVAEVDLVAVRPLLDSRVGGGD